jgi:hypothetical protein
MDLDVRVPIGILFTLLGAILVTTGLITAASLDVWAGAGMLAFGSVLLLSISRPAPSLDRRR